jgi:hypothetical protein
MAGYLNQRNLSWFDKAGCLLSFIAWPILFIQHKIVRHRMDGGTFKEETKSGDKLTIITGTVDTDTIYNVGIDRKDKTNAKLSFHIDHHGQFVTEKEDTSQATFDELTFYSYHNTKINRCGDPVGDLKYKTHVQRGFHSVVVNRIGFEPMACCLEVFRLIFTIPETKASSGFSDPKILKKRS